MMAGASTHRHVILLGELDWSVWTLTLTNLHGLIVARCCLLLTNKCIFSKGFLLKKPYLPAGASSWL